MLLCLDVLFYLQDEKIDYAKLLMFQLFKYLYLIE